MSLTNPKPTDKDLSEYQISTFRTLVIFSPIHPDETEKIIGDQIRGANQYGVLLYTGGSFKELVPWHRVIRLNFHARDFALINQLEGRDRGR